MLIMIIRKNISDTTNNINDNDSDSNEYNNNNSDDIMMSTGKQDKNHNGTLCFLYKYYILVKTLNKWNLTNMLVNQQNYERGQCARP